MIEGVYRIYNILQHLQGMPETVSVYLIEIFLKHTQKITYKCLIDYRHKTVY